MCLHVHVCQSTYVALWEQFSGVSSLVWNLELELRSSGLHKSTFTLRNPIDPNITFPLWRVWKTAAKTIIIYKCMDQIITIFMYFVLVLYIWLYWFFYIDFLKIGSILFCSLVFILSPPLDVFEVPGLIGIEPRSSHMLGKSSTTEFYLWPTFAFSVSLFIKITMITHSFPPFSFL